MAHIAAEISCHVRLCIFTWLLCSSQLTTGAAFLALDFLPREKVIVGAWKAAAEVARRETIASFILMVIQFKYVVEKQR